MPDIIGQVPSSTGGDPLVIHQQVVAGDDYKAADGRALSWPSGVFPDLAGATLSMVVGHSQYNLYGNLPVTWTGTVPASPDDPPVVKLDVTAAETAVLVQGEYDYMLHAILADGDVVTLAIGKLTVQANPGTVSLFPPAI